MSVGCDTNNSQFIYPPQGCGLQDDDLTLTTTFETLNTEGCLCGDGGDTNSLT